MQIPSEDLQEIATLWKSGIFRAQGWKETVLNLERKFVDCCQGNLGIQCNSVGMGVPSVRVVAKNSKARNRPALT